MIVSYAIVRGHIPITREDRSLNRNDKNSKRKVAIIAVLSMVLAVLVGVTVWLEVQPESANHQPEAMSSTTPPQTTLEQTTAEQTTLQQTTPEQTTPEQTTPGQTTPGQTTPEQTTPGQTPPPQTTPEQTTPRPTPAPTTASQPEYPDVEIKTPYATLYYPGQYKDYLEIEVLDDGFEATVLFYSTAGGHRDALMFTIFFGGADGEPLGSYQTSQGFAVDVTMEMSGYIPDDSWSTSDADIFYAMQEGMNHVIRKLEGTPGFTPVQS